MRRHLEDFAVALRAARRAETTINARLGDLRRFEDATGCEDAAGASVKELRSYLADLAVSRRPEYVKRVRSSFRVFFGWLHAEGLRDDNPASMLAAISIPREVRRLPAPEDLVHRAAAAKQSITVRLIILLAASIGLRRQEIARLRLSDRQDDTLYVCGKGGHVRWVPLDDLTLSTLRAREREVGFAEFYFPGRFGGHVHSATIAKWAAPHLEGHCLHSLRHRAATIGYKATKDIRAVQDVLGHRSLETTQRYVAHDPLAVRALVQATSLGATDPSPAGTRLASLLAEVRRLELGLEPYGLTLMLTPTQLPLVPHESGEQPSVGVQSPRA